MMAGRLFLIADNSEFRGSALFALSAGMTCYIARLIMTTKLKLFIWTDFCTDYTSGLAFAIAKDETDARKQIEKERGHPVLDWGDLEIKPLSRRVARCVSGGG